MGALVSLRAFIMQAFTYQVIADYDEWIEVSKEKAEARKDEFNWHSTIATDLDRLADQLTFSQIDPQFHVPKSFERFAEPLR